MEREGEGLEASCVAIGKLGKAIQGMRGGAIGERSGTVRERMEENVHNLPSRRPTTRHDPRGETDGLSTT